MMSHQIRNGVPIADGKDAGRLRKNSGKTPVSLNVERKTDGNITSAIGSMNKRLIVHGWKTTETSRENIGFPIGHMKPKGQGSGEQPIRIGISTPVDGTEIGIGLSCVNKH